MDSKEQMLQYFAPLYILNKLYKEDGLSNPEKYKNDSAFLAEIERLQNQDEDLIAEISNAASDTSGKFNNVWEKANELVNSPTYAKDGAKLDYIKSLNSYKKGKKIKPVKCKCGCEMVEAKEAGGKIVSKCACNCGGGKIKKKEKGGILDEYDLEDLKYSGIGDSITNKWERKIKANKIGKFKK